MKNSSLFMSIALTAVNLMAASPHIPSQETRSGVSLSQHGLGLTYETPKTYTNLSINMWHKVQKNNPDDVYKAIGLWLTAGPKTKLLKDFYHFVAFDGAFALIDNWSAFDDGRGLGSIPFHIGVATGFLIEIKPNVQAMVRLPVIKYNDNGEKGVENNKVTSLFGGGGYTTGVTYYFK